jgi:hypothetical protein
LGLFAKASLVTSRDISPRTAEEIAKLPTAAQNKFGSQVLKNSFSKETVSNLVKLYNAPETAERTRASILLENLDKNILNNYKKFISILLDNFNTYISNING